MRSDRWPGRSWYADEAGPDRSGASPLSSEASADVAVIGAGLAGMTTALTCLERGIERVVLIEADEVGSGASGRNGGFVFGGFSLDNDALADELGDARAATLHQWTRESVRRIRRRIEDHRLDCQANDAGVVLTDWFHDDEALRAFAERMQRRLGFGLTWLAPSECAGHVNSRRYGAGLHEPGSFHFHPLRHIRELARLFIERGGRIFCRTRVAAIERACGQWQLRTDRGRVLADEVVLTTGGYDLKLRPGLQRALQPIATYIAVTEPLDSRLEEVLPRPVAVYDNRFAFDYYRPLPDRRLLWGGRISIASRSPAAIRRLMKRDLNRVFPLLSDVRLEQAWGGWMSYARHEMPILGQDPEGVWHGLAFGGHGMATTSLAGDVLAEAISGDRRRLDAFRPWGAPWAGGRLGRLAVQGHYWQLQARDWWRARHRRAG
jgi:glycine/D-amino acid oxidase-like deaminating enzyme